VTLGAHTVVGANAVVLCDVPEGATAVGVPARILAPRALPIAAIEPEAAA
jgi:serine O-acetyltransferase